MPAPGHAAMLQQLAVHGLEQGRDAIDAQALLVVPDGVAVGNGGTAFEQAKALVAHAIQELVLSLLIAELVQVLQDQVRTMTSVGYGRRHPWGSKVSIVCVRWAKSMCRAMNCSRLPRDSILRLWAA